MDDRYAMKTLILVSILVAACGQAASPSPAGQALTGTFELFNGQGNPVQRTDTDCRGTGGYSDIHAGISAVVRDDKGTIVGSSRLTPLPEQKAADGRIDFRERNTCRFEFTIPQLPEAPFYTIEVGDRGELTYSRADLEAQGWTVELNLGN